MDVAVGGLWMLSDWCSVSAIWSKRSSSISCFIPLIYKKSRAYSILNYIRRYVFKYFFGSCVGKPRDLV